MRITVTSPLAQQVRDAIYPQNHAFLMIAPCLTPVSSRETLETSLRSTKHFLLLMKFGY